MKSAKEVLKHYWGYDSFRTLQEDIINSVVEGNDTLALLPTGGGKSVCFQIPALMMDGICVVVTPLIALMLDQVEHLNKRDIPAAAIYSGLGLNAIENILSDCYDEKIKFLYLSPERLLSKKFIFKLQQLNVSLLAIDEAHCISQWGYDFRPPYLKIAETKKLFPNITTIAVTATATPKVAKDICEKLEMQNPKVFVKSFVRSNLSYMVRKEEDKIKKLIRICTVLPGSGIVYVRNRKLTAEISNKLNINNISATFYHAGLSSDERMKRQSEWMSNSKKVMVATNAFGMGIDKPDVRFVVHIDVPEGFEAYYQEAGRAGRDGEKSYAVVIYNNADVDNARRNLQTSWTNPETIKKIYQNMCDYLQLGVGDDANVPLDFDLNKFCKKNNLKPLVAYQALKIIEREGYITLNEAWDERSKVIFNCSKNELYSFEGQNNNLDELIKAILRTYTGVFSSYTAINENNLALILNKDRVEIDKMLESLANQNIITYIKQSVNPQIVFNFGRIDVKEIKLSKELYYERRELALSNLEGVIDYLEDTNRCKSSTLVSYFGEKNAKDCNVCDYCLKKQKDKSDAGKQNIIQKQVYEIVSKQSVSVEELVKKIPKYSEKSILDEVQSMVEEGRILYESDRLKIGD